MYHFIFVDETNDLKQGYFHQQEKSLAILLEMSHVHFLLLVGEVRKRQKSVEQDLELPFFAVLIGDNNLEDESRH